MIFQRIKIEPLGRMTKPNSAHDGIPVLWYGENPPGIPFENEKWVPVEERPTPGENQRIIRELTTEKDGWKLVDLTPEEISERDRPEPVTKLDIMKRLVALDKWTTFETILSGADSLTRSAWELALEVRADDPFFVSNKELFKAGLGLNDEEFDALLSPSEQI